MDAIRIVEFGMVLQDGVLIDQDGALGSGDLPDQRIDDRLDNPVLGGAFGPGAKERNGGQEEDRPGPVLARKFLEFGQNGRHPRSELGRRSPFLEKRDGVVRSQLQQDGIARPPFPFREIPAEERGVGLRVQSALGPFPELEVQAFLRGQRPEIRRHGTHQTVAGATDDERRRRPGGQRGDKGQRGAKGQHEPGGRPAGRFRTRRPHSRSLRTGFPRQARNLSRSA
jgi:hypothetical protein